MPYSLTSLCHLRWVTGEWGTCSASCGQTGWQRRWVSCQQMSSVGQQQRSVHSKLCGEARPNGKQTCNRFQCPAVWRAGPWTPVQLVKPGDFSLRHKITLQLQVLLNSWSSSTSFYFASQCPRWIQPSSLWTRTGLTLPPHFWTPLYLLTSWINVSFLSVH